MLAAVILCVVVHAGAGNRATALLDAATADNVSIPEPERAVGRVIRLDEIPVDTSGRYRPDLLPGTKRPAPVPAEVTQRLAELSAQRDQISGARPAMVAPTRIGDVSGGTMPRMDSGDPNPDGIVWYPPLASAQ